MQTTNLQILDLNEILYSHKWNPFQITKLYYGRSVDGELLKDGAFYEAGSNGFKNHIVKLMKREFRFDGIVNEGTEIENEYLMFDIPSFGYRYIIYRKKK